MSPTDAAAALLMLGQGARGTFDLGSELDQLRSTESQAEVLSNIMTATAYFQINEKDIVARNALGAVFGCLPSDNSHVDLLCKNLILHWRALHQWQRMPRKGDSLAVAGVRGQVLRIAVKGVMRHGLKTYASFLLVQTKDRVVWAPFVKTKRVTNGNRTYVGPKLYCVKGGKLIHIMPKSVCELVAPGIVRFAIPKDYVELRLGEANIRTNQIL
jgi:hypothetical protein